VPRLRGRQALRPLRQHILLLQDPESLRQLRLRKPRLLLLNAPRQPACPVRLRLLPVRPDRPAPLQQAKDSHLVRDRRDHIQHVQARRKACARLPRQGKADPVVRRGPAGLRPDFRNGPADGPEMSQLAARGRAQ